MDINDIRKYLKQYFDLSDNTAKQILNQVTFFIYENESPTSDMYMLARLLDDDSLKKIIDYFEDSHLKIPSIEEFNYCLLLSITFFLKEIKGMSWKEIKKILDINDNIEEFSSISLGKKLSKLKNDLTKQLFNAIENLDSESKEIKNLLREIKEKNGK